MDFKENISLAELTTFKIGGPAKLFAEVKNQEELIDCLQTVIKNNYPYFILGGGSNVLVSDKGFDGLVIKLVNENIELDENIIRVGAGIKMFRLIESVLTHNLIGLEWAVGIPGTLGGCVRGNAGAFGKSMKDCISSVETIQISGDEVNKKTYSNSECKFDNRESIFKHNNDIIWQIELKLEIGDINKAREEIKEHLDQRKIKQPLDYPSAGSVFKNILLKDHPNLPDKFSNIPILEGKIPAGWFIEQCGLKGKTIGKAQISEKHANFIINLGNAKAQDVIELIKIAKDSVFEKFSVKLEEEIQLIGF